MALRGKVQKNKKRNLKDCDGFGAMEEIVRAMLRLSQPESGCFRADVYVLVGVNGAGKTTTIAKLAERWRSQVSVIMAAPTPSGRLPKTN